MLKYCSALVLVVLLSGCSPLVIQETFNPESIPAGGQREIAIVPFKNYTETPVAGYRAASILQSVMRRKGYTTYFFAENEKDQDLPDFNHRQKQKLLKTYLKKAAQKDIPLLLTGAVQEWRYKTGIDGEPAVSYTISVYDTSSGMMTFSSVGAKSGWGHESLGIIAQKIGEKLIE